MATARTATPQNPQQKAIKTTRTRALTAAKKSLGLIEEAVAKHQADLEAGTVPSASLPSTARYEAHRFVLETLDKLAGGEPIEPDEESAEPEAALIPDPVQVRADIAVLLGVLAELAPELRPVEGYPLYRLQALCFPGGNGQPAARQQEPVS